MFFGGYVNAFSRGCIDDRFYLHTYPPIERYFIAKRFDDTANTFLVTWIATKFSLNRIYRSVEHYCEIIRNIGNAHRGIVRHLASFLDYRFSFLFRSRRLRDYTDEKIRTRRNRENFRKKNPAQLAGEITVVTGNGVKRREGGDVRKFI